MKYIDRIKAFWHYNHAHRQAVIEVERKCLGYNTLLTRIHDLDKFVMCVIGLPDEVISKIHRMVSWHHPNNRIGWFRMSEAIFDWESARFTKPDKPLNARETCLKYYPELENEVIPRCNEYGI